MYTMTKKEMFDFCKGHVMPEGVIKYNEETKLFEIYKEEEVINEEALLQNKRFEREPLLRAFDVYKSNVAYGIETDTNHNVIVTWYQALLNLKEEAFDNIPEEIKRYL